MEGMPVPDDGTVHARDFEAVESCALDLQALISEYRFVVPVSLL